MKAFACTAILMLSVSFTDGILAGTSIASEIPASIDRVVRSTCIQCHGKQDPEAGLDLSSLTFELRDQQLRDTWTKIHDRINNREMPPDPGDLSDVERAGLVTDLAGLLHDADIAEVMEFGRGPMRRINRDEYEQNLRDLLKLPTLDVRDMLPEDRESHHFNKSAATLDMSHVQLTAYLDAAELALRQAMASGDQPPPVTKYRAIGTQLFPERSTFGEREAMFFAKDNRAVEGKQLDELQDDPTLEMALFRSAHWPYYGYPKNFVANLPGEYRVRFSARAVVQLPNFELKPAILPVPMTFRARKPSGPDVSGDVRATGGVMDVLPEASTFATAIILREHETFEYSLLGLPVPLARNVDGGPPTYRYPPFPEGGQPGVAFQWLEVEGPVSPATWPPPSHEVLFDNLPADGYSSQHVEDARRLFRRFVHLAAREPMSADEVRPFEDLVLARLAEGEAFAEALLAGYKAFLCSAHFLYLNEPTATNPQQDGTDHFAIASRLSHFLTNTRPDDLLVNDARQRLLRNADTLRQQTNRLIDSSRFKSFVRNFTDYWLSLRHLRRDEPDIRLYPEYRFDDYLVESMEFETQAFFTAMVRDNLPVRVLVDSNFVFANDRIAKHYGLEALSGSTMRKVQLADDSPYGGLLTQAAILKVTANGTSTSPVVRGAWIMDRLIGQPAPPPPASVPAVEPDIRGAKTIRDLLALHTKSESCAKCHAKFDSVGLALESFDILGGWRTHYRGMEQGVKVTGIDRAGHDFSYTLTAPVDPSGHLSDGQLFQDIRDLKAILSTNPRQLARNLLGQFTVYATGTPVRFSDRAEIEAILDASAGEDYRVRDLMIAFVQSRIFLGHPKCE